MHLTVSTASPRRKPASMSSSMCSGSGALAEYAVTGSRPSATATGIEPSAASQSARPSLWICQCMKVERESIFCIRYMPTLRTPVRGSLVITAGSVMNGAGSPGQQCWIGSASRSGSSTSSWQAPRETDFGIGVGEALELAQALDLLHEPLRRLHLEHVLELARHGVEVLLPEREAHAPLRPELVDEERPLGALDVPEEERRPAGLDDAVDDLGDLEVRVDLGLDLDQLALPLEQVDPGAKIGGRHRFESIREGALDESVSGCGRGGGPASG